MPGPGASQFFWAFFPVTHHWQWSGGANEGQSNFNGGAFFYLGGVAEMPPKGCKGTPESCSGNLTAGPFNPLRTRNSFSRESGVANGLTWFRSSTQEGSDLSDRRTVSSLHTNLDLFQTGS